MLGCSADLSEYSFFQRGTIKEGMTFTAKTVLRKTQVGGRQSVKASGSVCHVVVRESHLSAAVFCDEEYPARAAMSVAMQTVNDFQASGSTGWERTEVDLTAGQPLCDQALIKYKVSTHGVLRLQVLVTYCVFACYVNVPALYCRTRPKQTNSPESNKS